MFPPPRPAPLPPPPRPIGSGGPSTLGRVLAIVVGLLLLLAGVLLWPTFRALNGAIVEAIEDWRALVGGAVLLFALAVLASIVGMLVAIVRKMQHKASQAAIVKLPDGLPAHVRDVRGGRSVARLLPRALDQHYAAKLAEASRPMPQLHSYHQVLHNQLPPPPADAQSAPDVPALPGSGGTLAQMHAAGHVCRSGNSLLTGYADGMPQYIELPECGFIGIGGQPRVGKSTTTLLLIEQAVISGWHVFVGDPHIQKADGLLNRCRPLSGRLAKQAVTPEEIAIMVRTVDKIGRRRVNGDADRTPVLLVLDEFSNLVWRGLLPDDVLTLLPSMAAEYAGVHVHGILIAHDWSKASLGGDLGAALRRAITHRVIHRMDPGNTEFLLPRGSAAQARAVQGLDKGRALFYGPDGAAMVTVPWLTGTDAAYAAQGTPERPYAPRALPAPAPVGGLPPTARVAPRLVPPTDPLPPPTVQDEILLLLGSQSAWLTASEIATRIGADLAIVRTEIDTLYNRSGKLVRRGTRGKTTKERYEYQIQPVQSIQSHLTPSA